MYVCMYVCHLLLTRHVISPVDRATPFASPASLHFMACLRRYGSPVICLNLVKKRERKKRESLLTNELQSSITYLNQFLPPEHHIGYIHKDMARINKRFVSEDAQVCSSGTLHTTHSITHTHAHTHTLHLSHSAHAHTYIFADMYIMTYNWHTIHHALTHTLTLFITHTLLVNTCFCI